MLWLTLVVSQCIYLGLPVPEAAGASDDLPMLAGALAVVALSEAVGAFVWFRIAAVGRIQAGRIDPSTAEGAGRLLQGLIICPWGRAPARPSGRPRVGAGRREPSDRGGAAAGDARASA